MWKALHESGAGFTITASCGVARIPEDGSSGTEALRVADARMYEEKFSRIAPNREHLSLFDHRLLEAKTG